MTASSLIPLFSSKSASGGVDLNAAVKRVLDSHWYVLGSEVSSFEHEFAQYVGADYCVGLGTGTDALELALRAVGVERGDEVVTVANAGYYTSTVIAAIGAAALYVDVDDTTLNMSVRGLQLALQRNPKAIVVTHLYGQLADINELLQIARAANVPLIEDCAQAVGAQREGVRAGNFGAIGCFSFYPTKNLGAVGDGGAVVTSDPLLAERLRALRQYGWTEKYRVGVSGGRNSRLDEIQAAVLREKLPHLESWNDERRSVAQRYNRAFEGLPVQCPAWLAADYVAHLYVLRLDNREAFRAFLTEQGIATDVHYPIPDHLQPVCLQNNETATEAMGDLPITVSASERIVSLPCFPGLTDAQIQRVIQAVTGFFGQQA